MSRTFEQVISRRTLGMSQVGELLVVLDVHFAIFGMDGLYVELKIAPVAGRPRSENDSSGILTSCSEQGLE